MRHPLAATTAAAATLLLTACSAPSPAAVADPAHQPSRPSAAYQSSLAIRWPDGIVTHGIPDQARTGKRAAHAPGHQPISTTDRS